MVTLVVDCVYPVPAAVTAIDEILPVPEITACPVAVVPLTLSGAEKVTAGADE